MLGTNQKVPIGKQVMLLNKQHHDMNAHLYNNMLIRITSVSNKTVMVVGLEIVIIWEPAILGWALYIICPDVDMPLGSSLH